jgi:hypothetical protein
VKWNRGWQKKDIEDGRQETGDVRQGTEEVSKGQMTKCFDPKKIEGLTLLLIQLFLII